MKRILILPVVVLIFLLAASAVAEQALVDIHCDEQGYSTKMPAGKATTFQTGNGLRIWLDEPGYVPNVLIWVRSEDLEDPAVYVRDEYTDYMKKQYGTKLIGTTQYEYYDIGGKRLLGAAYIYKSSSGSNINQLHLYEIRGGEPDVEYNARYLNSERETTLAALDAAVRYYTPDNSSAGSQALETVHCAEQGFSTRMPAGKSATFQENNGLRIWLDEPGYVPNILIWRRKTDVSDPSAYIRDDYTGRMREAYGSRLVGTTHYEYYDTGGKRLFGAAYL